MALGRELNLYLGRGNFQPKTREKPALMNMMQPKYPSLYEINTRVWLTELSEELGRPATLDDIPESELIRLAGLGFDWVWFLSVWQTGEKGQKVSCENPEWRHEFEKTLPDLKEEDIGGSGFAIASYHVDSNLGGDAALKRLRKRLTKYGLKLMLDFVPNHMGLDHHWVNKHPDFFVSGSETDIERHPKNYFRVKNGNKELILAHGRDPFFEGWPDTVQLDYSNPATVEAMKKELLRISLQCDGVRCNMAMLILPEVFEKTWGRRAEFFWPGVTKAVRENFPDFCFMAEVYWNLEWTLQHQGFNYTYDSRLYDRLLDSYVKDIRGHLNAELAYQNKLARFLENHDERRAASTFFETGNHKAAAIITFLSPGLRFFHQGQLEGKAKRISPHLIRGPREPINAEIQSFYESLLGLLKRPVLRNGKWGTLPCDPAWEGNGTWDSFIVFTWQASGEDRMVVVVNYSPYKSQCYLRLPFTNHSGGQWRLQDTLSEACYDRDGNDLRLAGLYLDLEPWQYHAFEVKKIKGKSK